MPSMTPQSRNTRKHEEQPARFGLHAGGCSPANGERRRGHWCLRAFLDVGGWWLDVFSPSRAPILRFTDSAPRRHITPLVSALWLALALVVRTAAAADFRVGLVLDRGGKDDKSFNSSAYNGAMEAKTKLGVMV